MDLKVYNQEGKEVGKTRVSKDVFGVSWNADLLHQVVVSMQSNQRTPVAHAKTRAEVRGGGAKPWRQKGTGRARHGSIRSPIWKGGGVTHGPLKEKNYKKKINKKMKKKALCVALSQKAKDKEILVLDDLKLEEAKTQKASEIISNLSKIKGFEKLITKRKNRALILTKQKKEDLKRAFNNLPGVSIAESRNLNPLDVLTYKYLVFTKDSLNFLKKPTSPASQKEKG
jgi:large subunit ribosomal protein L4